MTDDKIGTDAPAAQIAWPGVIALLGASLPLLLVGSTVLWWNLRGRPSGGDVLWLYVILMVPALVLDAVMMAIGFICGRRAARKGALSHAGERMMNASLAVCVLTAVTALALVIR